MAERKKTFRGLAEAFRLSLYPPKAGFSEQAPQLVEAFLGLRRQAKALDPDALRACGEMAVHLLVWAETQKGGPGLLSALRGLLNLGRFGWIAAVRLVRGKNVPLQQLAQTVAALTARERILLLHELLRDPDREDKPLMQWAKDELTALAQCDPEQALEALLDVGVEGEPLAHVLKEFLLRGPFLPWLEGLLGGELAAGTLERLARAVQVAADETLTSALAAHVAERPAQASPGLVATLAATCETSSGAVVRAVQAVLRKSKDQALTLACLDALIGLHWPKAGQVAALLFKKDESLRKALLARLPLLSEADFRLFLSALPDQGQRAAYARAFLAVLDLDPDFVWTCLDSEAGGTTSPRLDKETEEPFRALVAERKRSLLAGFSLGEGAKPPALGQAAAEDKKGLLSRLKGDKKANLAEALQKAREVSGLDLSGAGLASAAVVERKLVNLRLAGSDFEKVRFDKCKLSAVDLFGSAFKAVVFTNCTFANVRFAGAAFNRSTFSACSFERCDFSDAEFSDCSFSSCDLQKSLLGGSRWRKCAFDLTTFDLCCFAAARIEDTRASACRFAAVDFSGAALRCAEFKGVEFGQATLRRTSVLSSAFPGCRLADCTLPDAFLRGVDALDPALLRRQAEGILDAGRAAVDGAALLPQVALAEVGFGFMKRVVHLWAKHWQISRLEWPMFENNRRRIAFALARLSAGQREFFKLLPHLLHTDAFEKALAIPDVPACQVHGHTTDLVTLGLMRKHFPTAEPREAPENPIRIEAVYTIGSLGSIAQTATSDIDYWICFEPAGVSAQALAGLKRKLDALSVFAAAKFELETHFFAMSMDDIRANDFGLSDKESAGSTQAILLKEEFYRTAVRVAGKALAWWIAPPGADEQAYRACVAAAQGYPLSGTRRFADLGQLAQIPAEEFFGASLWQIVKALHSPYKSVMKLGLLERYAGMVQSRGLMLCDQIKRNLLEGRREVRDVDPYTVLFKELEEFYLAVKDKDAVTLMREAFLLKAGFSEIDFFFGCAGRREEQSFLSAVFGPAGDTPETAAGRGKAWTFARSMQVGVTVNRYMINTYQRIQSQLSPEVRARARITPEDLTKLGRQIIANFAPKQGKVLRVPFLLAAEGEFPELHFTAEKVPGKRTVWVAQGKERSGGKTGIRNMQVLKKDFDPVMLMAWLVVNKIYTPGGLVDGERSIAPLAVVDIQKILAGLYEFFPYEQTFEADSNVYLELERVTRAFFILNLTAAQDLQRVAQAWVVYSTNLGELFCAFYANPGPLIARQPSAFLKESLPHPTLEKPAMRLYVPKRSQCPRIPMV